MKGLKTTQKSTTILRISIGILKQMDGKSFCTQSLSH